MMSNFSLVLILLTVVSSCLFSTFFISFFTSGLELEIREMEKKIDRLNELINLLREKLNERKRNQCI